MSNNFTRPEKVIEDAIFDHLVSNGHYFEASEMGADIHIRLAREGFTALPYWVIVETIRNWENLVDVKALTRTLMAEAV